MTSDRAIRWQLKSLAGVAIALAGAALGMPRVVEVGTALNAATIVVIAGECLWILMGRLHD